MILTETDTHNLLNESSYVVQGYKTILPIKSPEDNLVRIVCLVKESLFSSIKTRLDLMSKDFPSIWLEYQPDLNKKPTLIAGFYRVWTHEGENSIESQIDRMEKFNTQIENAFEQKKCTNLLILGDANLCADRWHSPKFLNKKVARPLQNTLSRCGLKIECLSKRLTSVLIIPSG